MVGAISEWRLSRALLNDPAFSSDPRSHPHFPLPFDPFPPPKLVQVPTIIPRKASMKALVRRLTSHHNLDRIDELDETDPFGGSYHHDGPYEAIDTNHVTPHVHSASTPPRRTDIHHSKREFIPRPLHPAQHQSTPRLPSVHGVQGLSLHLEPGQILRHNTIYSTSSTTSLPSRFPRQSNTAAVQPDHSRSQSLPNPRSRSLEDSSLHPLDDLHNRPSSFSRAPPNFYPGHNTPNLPNVHHDGGATPYVLSRTETTVFPPPRYQSRLHNSGHSRSPQRTPPTPFTPTPRKTQATESAMPALPSYDPRHQSVHSVDDSYTINSTITRSSSSIRKKPSEPPRIRHLPKRLVMPAPLQPQPPQPQYIRPPAESVAWHDEYPDHHTLEGANFEGPPAMYMPGPSLLRKKSSAFAENMPIPHHIPMPLDDAVPTMGTTPSKGANEVEGTKEKTRRRKLSKRKNDI